LLFLLPELILCGLGLAATVAALFYHGRAVGRLALCAFFVCLAGVVTGLCLLAYAIDLGPEATGKLTPGFIARTFAVDPLSLFFSTLALAVCGLAMLFSMEFVEEVLEEHQAEFLALIAFASLGVACVARSRDLITLFFSLELVSISGYLLSGMLRRDPRSLEAALKYFLIGAVSSAIMLFGMSLIYGLTGATDLHVLRDAIGEGQLHAVGQLAGVRVVSSQDPVVITGILCIVVGLGFKIAMVPFHMWCPDVYEGAPTPATAFLSVGPKAAGFVAIVRLLMLTFAPSAGAAPWAQPVLWLCALSMTLGNVVACRQTNLKRMLAYSSIAHSGYILIAVVSLGSTDIAIPAIVVYLVAYVLMNVGAFSVVIALSNVEGREDIHAYNGLSKRSPYLAYAWVIFAMSLAGVPPTAGFLGKLYVFMAALDDRVRLYWLAIVGVVNAVISVWYYFRVARHMFFVEGAHTKPIRVGRGTGWAIGLSLAGTLLLVPFFPWLVSFAADAAQALGTW